MANLGPMMPGLASSTASRVDSSSKHILACRVGEHYMLEWCNANGQDKRRELHVNKHKYCVFKNELVLNVTRPLFPLDSIAQYNETKAYPSVVSTLADMDLYGKHWLKSLYFRCTANDFWNFWTQTVQTLNVPAPNARAIDGDMRALLLQHDRQNWTPDINDHNIMLAYKSTIKNMPFFTAQGYALGTAWASQQTGDTVASVLIGGMQTVMNGAFACAAGEVLQWYFDFEEDQFAHKTQNMANVGAGQNAVIMAGQRPLYAAAGSHVQDPAVVPATVAESDGDALLVKRRRFHERMDGMELDGSGDGMKRGTFRQRDAGGREVWKSQGCGKAFPKPYRMAMRLNGHELQYFDHYGDRIRIFAKCISSARPHEMVDVMLMTQSL